MSKIILGENVLINKNLGVSGTTQFIGGITGDVSFNNPVYFPGGITGEVLFNNPAYFPGGITGNVSVNGKVQSTYSVGEEGGEFFLSKGTTGTINNGVTIDVWNDRLRFFEQGGSSRGYYLDIAHGDNDVATNIGQNRLFIQGTTGSGVKEGGITAGNWTKRKLNNFSSNGCFIGITGASLSSNQLTLPTGRYYVDVSAPGHGIGVFTIRLQSITGTSISINGTSEYSSSSGGAGAYTQTRSVIKGKIVLATTTVLEVQQKCTSSNTDDGLGHAGGISGVDNVYTILSAVTM